MPAVSAVTATQVLNMARSQIGTLETPPGSNRIKYNDWFVAQGYGKKADYIDAQWCAIFVSWVFAQVGAAGKGVPLVPIHAWTPSGLDWFQARGQVDRGRNPRPGDVVYVHYPGSSEIVGHVGIVEAVLGNGWIQTIEGNTNTNGSATGIGVFRLRRAINDRLYFCHPQYAQEASQPSQLGGDVKLSDVIGKDATGQPLTVGQALARGDSAYHALFSTGWFGKRMAVVESRTAPAKDALGNEVDIRTLAGRGDWVYHAWMAANGSIRKPFNALNDLVDRIATKVGVK